MFTTKDTEDTEDTEIKLAASMLNYFVAQAVGRASARQREADQTPIVGLKSNLQMDIL